MSTIWINAGERSGDLQASRLLQALKEYNPEIKAYGMGSIELAAAGQENLLNSDELSVMGITEVFTVLPHVFTMLRRIEKELSRLRPEVVILVDAPEFNFRVAKIAYKLGLQVCYFISPKIWAWRTRRVWFLKKYTNSIISILPFEQSFYRKYGMEIDYVGNPLVDLVNWEEIHTIAPIKGRIGIMPGSRKKEVAKLLPEFAQAAKKLLLKYPHVTFFCLRSSNIPEELIQSIWPKSIPLQIEVPEYRYMAMRSCEYIVAASGTAVLETALAGVPTVITYKVGFFSEIVARFCLKVKWVGLPNLILGREVFPELLQNDACGKKIADLICCWMEKPSIKIFMEEAFSEIRDKCGDVGSACRAAKIILHKFFT